MRAKDYIQYRLDDLLEPSVLSKPSSKDELIDEITKRVLSKKFRKYSMDPERLEHVKNAVRLNVENNEPIKFTLPFGGYKLWRLKESPQADWAELFAMMYYTRWMKPLCKIYGPGVWFDFFSDDAVVQRMNNIPQKDTMAYRESFKELLQFIKVYQPNNLNMSFTRVGDQYENQAAFDSELDQRIAETQTELKGDFPNFTETQKATIELNVKTTPEQYKDPLWREKVFLIHESYGKMSKRRPYYRVPEKIMVVTTPLWGMLCVGTTKDSVAKFWCGVGALRTKKDTYRQVVLTPSQLTKIKATTQQITINGLTGKNFGSILVTD